jgi:hypothetical protein
MNYLEVLLLRSFTTEKEFRRMLSLKLWRKRQAVEVSKGIVFYSLQTMENRSQPISPQARELGEVN